MLQDNSDNHINRQRSVGTTEVLEQKLIESEEVI
jgi:molybdate-binding protein